MKFLKWLGNFILEVLSWVPWAILFFFMEGCTTTVTVEKPVFPTPPPELVAPPLEPTPLPAGNLSPKDALTIITQNNILLMKDLAQYKALRDWLDKTSTSINGPKRD